MCFMTLRINSYYFSKQLESYDVYNVDAVCFHEIRTQVLNIT
jgi:hypothetical protein